MRLRRFLISEPMAERNATGRVPETGNRPGPRRYRRCRSVGSGVIGSTGSFGVPSRGSSPRSRAMSQYRPLSAVVLAAGEGTRMRSGTPKVLHPLCGRPMVLHVVDALAELPLERVVIVVGHGAERVTKTLQEQLVTEVPVEFVEQRVQRGTGDAMSVALTLFDDLDAEDDILVLPSDAPLVRAETIAKLATQ